jgi:hypothetical protein
MEDLVKPLESAYILGVLEQIQKVNYMIDVHRQHEEDSMAKQFERQREVFLAELTNLLATIHIHADLKVAA